MFHKESLIIYTESICSTRTTTKSISNTNSNSRFGGLAQTGIVLMQHATRKNNKTSSNHDSTALRLNHPFVDEIGEQTDQQEKDRHHRTP